MGDRARRYDPARRERIVEACLDVIAEHGLAGTSHRRVAAAADVPLGSMTYHFSGMDELLREAFVKLSDDMATRFEARLQSAESWDAAKAAVVAIIEHDVFGDQRDLVLTHELYTLAARVPAYREVTNAWMRRSRAALERHFDPLTSHILDAAIEGLTIHAALDTEPPDPRAVREAVERICAPGPAVGEGSRG